MLTQLLMLKVAFLALPSAVLSAFSLPISTSQQFNCSSSLVGCSSSTSSYMNTPAVSGPYVDMTAGAFFNATEIGVGSERAFVMINSARTASRAVMRLFSSNSPPTRLASLNGLSETTSERSTLVVYPSGRFYWGTIEDIMTYGTVTLNSGTYSIGITSSWTINNKHTSNSSLQDSSYLYAFGNPQLSNPSYYAQGIKMSLGTTSNTNVIEFRLQLIIAIYATQWTSSGMGVLSHGDGYLLHLDMTSMKPVKTMSVTFGSPAITLAMVYDATLDRQFLALHNRYLVRVVANDLSSEVWRIENSFLASTGYDRLLSVNSMGLLVGHMVDFKNRLRLMRKIDFSLVADAMMGNSIYHSSIVVSTHQIVPANNAWRVTFFFTTAVSTVYANSFNFTISICDVLDGSGNCVNCGDTSVSGLSSVPQVNTVSPNCSLLDTIADGYGYGMYSQAAQPCSDANCQTCFLKFTVCFKCKSGYYLLFNGACYNSTTIPNGYGFYGNNAIQCLIKNCASCKFDATACTACYTGFKLLGGQCIYQSDLTYYGKDTSTSGTLLPCSVPFCASCDPNYLVCNACMINTNPVYVLFPNNTCLPHYKFPDGIGLTTSNTSTPCYDTNCKNCSANYAICVECLTNITRYFVIGTSCYTSSSLPSGFGANLSSTTNDTMVYPCLDSFCSNCKLDYTKCFTCMTGKYYYNDLCYVREELPTSIGPVVTSSPPIATSCQDNNCDDCKIDYRICRKCKAGLTPQLYASTSGVCSQVTSITGGYGANLLNYSIQTCLITGCTLCQSDYTVCTSCSSGWSLYNGTCMTYQQLPNGYGPSRTAYVAVPCSDSYCLNCSVNYFDYCYTCNPVNSPLRYLYNYACLLPSQLPNGYGANNLTLTATSCYIGSSVCLKCQNDYKICTECNNPIGTTNPYYLFDGSCFKNYSLPKYYGAHPSYVATPCSQPTCKYCQANYSQCTQCEPFTTPLTYYYSVNLTCLLMSEIPDLYGPRQDSSGFGYASICSKSNCQQCQSDYLVCTKCQTATPPLYLFNNACVGNSSLPDYYGADATTMKGVPCSSSRCQKCYTDYSKCNLCKVQYPAYYYYNTTDQCLLTSEIPINFGANLTSGNSTSSPIVSPCTQTTCQNCREDNTRCLGCSLSNGTASYLWNGNCISLDILPPYYGADNITYTAKMCTNPRCKYCRPDYKSCTQCNIQSPELYLYQNGTNVSCLTSQETPGGMGADSASLTLKPCAVPFCNLCTNDYLRCTACNTSVLPRVYFLNGSCVLPAHLPNPYGANDFTGLATACADLNCNECKENYAFCTDCKRVSPETFLFTQFGICILKKNIAPGFGADYTTYSLKPCADPNCKICTLNYLRCLTCVTSPEQYYVNGTICVKNSEIVEGYGIENSTLMIRECQSSGCIDCKANYSECHKCTPPPIQPSVQNPKLYLFNKRCDSCTDSPLKIVDYECKSICDKSGCSVKLMGTKFIKTKVQLRAQFSESIVVNSTVKTFISFVTSQTKRNLSSTEFEIQILNDVMLITLNITDDLAAGTLYYERENYEEIPIRAAGSKVPFFNYPIKFPEIYIERSSAIKALSSASSTTTDSTASAKVVAQLVVITQSSNIAKIPDQMVSNLVYLKFLNGETYLYPSMVFDFFASSQVPFVTLSSPWDISGKQPQCLVAPKFFDANLDCSILVNYGVDILVLYITLAINILLSIGYYLAYGARLSIYKKHGEDQKVTAIEKSKAHKVFKFITDNYGLKMFFVKLDGTMVEVIFFASLTLTSQPIVNSSYLYAYLISLGFYGYYAWSIATYVRMLIHIKPRLENVRRIEMELQAADPKHEIKPLAHYVDFTRVKHGLVGYQIEDYRSDLEFVYMFAPVVWFGRCVAINIFLAGGTNMKSGQFYAYLIVEGAYLYYLVKSKVKASRFENWLSFFNEGSQMAYVLVHAIGYYLKDRETKQKTIGAIQAGIIILMMLFNIGYVFVVFFWNILIKPIVNLCKKKPAFPPHERLGDDAPELQALGKVINDKKRKKLVVTRAELDVYAATRQPNQPHISNEIYPEEELKGLTNEQPSGSNLISAAHSRKHP